ncbi:MAG: 50S ribosomal protein L2 [Candidatus Moranbacteria bacterium GW2011_GWE2_35_2-]|nr:MAG: 50S ribosomal protein L2 [Candidatus Moranbacteria bacterium GW2011_GWE2_35_2-]KKQ04922.1 MAG: 50S ribosomal protein L2 [Candidatus Moranbacteria bacterium GW2011_GWF1_36_4]KKQ22926.1 MAG: 50S ribosomal protein L2 [Candidatus Moranbacteria bacterium GW2011_GWF2_37_11]KKQ29284.1 MAG: 50S ribosomal protein L2 [Candidatus Moranbacteria bacterium GW2011_GWD1_37_17]KKQ30843.1 MAG: 50S ribosomal protein L2 [Candidatus Moranbacteria bacterium GW2011_GWE1_37_24]KKQ47954.1 MAG: 50S ribosomal pr
MAIKVYKRNTAGRRNMSIVKPDNLTDKKPEKSLLAKKSKKSGRSHGKISVRHMGGGHKQKYRVIDFKQNKLGISGKIEAIEKDPNRSALIALVYYKDGEKRYVIATENMKKGQEIITDEKAPLKEGNRLKLKNILPGTVISNIEIVQGKGGQMVRSAGSEATLMGVDNKMAQIKLSSGEIRLINCQCYATIGKVSNFEHNAIRIGKAGKSRWLGRRPVVRGSAMNPVDHPHGGGEGRQGIGLKYPKTPWGKPALGKKTRRSKKHSSKYIIKRRTK